MASASLYLEELVLALSPLFSIFSFNLFGIFVNISNKIPPLLKAGGTLGVI